MIPFSNENQLSKWCILWI